MKAQIILAIVIASAASLFAGDVKTYKAVLTVPEGIIAREVAVIDDGRSPVGVPSANRTTKTVELTKDILIVGYPVPVADDSQFSAKTVKGEVVQIKQTGQSLNSFRVVQ